MAERKLIVERKGAVAIATLNDPATRNALSTEMAQSVATFFKQAQADETIGCIVLAAAGDGFCSGGNVKDMLAGTDPMFSGTPQQQQEGYRAGAQVIPRVLHEVDVPIVAAVQGAAIGAGCDITCMCDIRVASTDAKFAESFLRVGLVSGDGGAWFLPRVVGMPRALEMALTCRVVEAEEAQQWGLVNSVVPREKLLEKALETAAKIASFPPRSARLNKRLIRQSLNLTLPDCLELSAAFQAIVQSTADQKEAVAAFVEKRAPKFTGR